MRNIFNRVISRPTSTARPTIVTIVGERTAIDFQPRRPIYITALDHPDNAGRTSHSHHVARLARKSFKCTVDAKELLRAGMIPSRSY